jgi:hypothetical protein
VSDFGGLGELLAGADAVLDALRFEQKRLEESLSVVRERISAGEAVLAAAARWRAVAESGVCAVPGLSLPAAPAVVSAAGVLARQAPAQGQAGVSRRAAMVLLLAQDPGRVWRSVQVAEALGCPDLDGVRSEMAKLASAGRIVRVGSGVYRAGAGGV